MMRRHLCTKPVRGVGKPPERKSPDRRLRGSAPLKGKIGERDRNSLPNTMTLNRTYWGSDRHIIATT